MIIKEIRIKNFRSYYGDNNKFEFSDGLTLILGDNGDGKTTFFEALQWLFNTMIDKPNMEHVSEMRKSKLEIDEEDNVSVMMTFEHNGLKSVEKSFSFERTGETSYRLGKLNFRGYETRGSERLPVDGKALINRCYEAFIQKFSMFKGESELNVFDNGEALKVLVDKFSDIRRFDSLVERSEEFSRKSEAAFKKEVRNDKDTSENATKITNDLEGIAEDMRENRRETREKLASLDVYKQRLEELESNQENSEKFKEIQGRLKTKNEQKQRLMANLTSVNYSHSLLDKMWILCAFPTVLKEFKQKCSQMSKGKRIQEDEFNAEQAKALGKLEAIQEIQGSLANGTARLPWYLPNQETMEEMIADHICKVCGRVAEEGSEAYHFMKHKLEEYKAHVEAELKRKVAKQEIQKKVLFPNTYIDKMHNLSISLSGSNEARIANISTEIIDRMELNETLAKQVKEVEEKIQEIMDEKSRLLIQAGNVSEAVLEKDFRDIRGLFEQKGRAEERLAELRAGMKLLDARKTDLEKQLNELNPANSQTKRLQEVSRILTAIAKAFSHAKEENLRRFLADLQDQANIYLAKLSVNDFHGEVRLQPNAESENKMEIKLYSSNGSEIRKPSGSQKTVMYISILFAISDFTQEKRDEDYPLIFDAATSSFGDSKEEGFYNIVDKLKKQCIIVTKDFIEKGNVRAEGIQNLTCSVYRIKKAEGFDPTNMATIRTIINKIR